jgi:hypothetical protein
MGAPQSAQLIIQGTIIAIGMGLRLVPWRRLLAAHPFGTTTRPEGGEP